MSKYEKDPDSFSGVYKIEGYNFSAWNVLGWEINSEKERTGRIIAVMVGDDRRHAFWPNEISSVEEGDYCPGCGSFDCDWR